MKISIKIAGAALAVALLLLAIIFFKGALVKSNQIDVVRTSFRKIDQFPDPAEINTSGKWYLLNHISSPLIEYSHKTSTFKSLIASKWDIDGSVYNFQISPTAKFHDGSNIKAVDVAQSIKRILVMKKSTHFPLWNHVEGCENLKNMNDQCSGLIFDDEKNTVTIKLKSKSESFLLQISSPESGIWSASDIDSSGALVPKKFSGPYSLENLKVNSEKELFLNRNSYSVVQSEFPSSPKKIIVKSLDRSVIDDYNNIPTSYLRLAVYPTDPNNPGAPASGDSTFSIAKAEKRTIEICFGDTDASTGVSSGYAMPQSEGNQFVFCQIKAKSDYTKKAFFLTHLLTHELGHCFGLMHPQEATNSVMSYFGETKLRLQNDDYAGITYAYPDDSSYADESATLGLIGCSPRN